ncbi:signal peptidase I [Enterococcus sp. 7F3_DIV0205]|uniref:Signal peptidase I n=1 Tax=Candidatus Enterococcus palustris TaxID=1834189 RepID=A0AAQ3Y7W6_9ENTE|nr:signal peptidase I [Enterococcus sp. 7F3_DIV0205]OTN83275.1 signal peptidase I [Enterococcus sp. 7F3_DIV0205]
MSAKKQTGKPKNKRARNSQSIQRTKKNKQALNKLVRRKKRNRLFIEVICGMGLLILLIYAQSYFFFSLAKVDSYAMSPTLKLGEYVLIEKQAPIQRQAIVLIKRKSAQKSELRRVIGLPTEKIAYQNDQLFINEEERAEPFIALEKKAAFENGFVYTKDFSLYEVTGVETIPKDTYFVMGDNRLYSTDSREYSVIKKEEIIGVVNTSQ